MFLPFSPHSLQTLTSNASLEIDNHITKKYSVTADNYEISFRKDSTQRVANHQRVLDSQRRFLVQITITILLRHCFEWLQHCSNIAALCCAQNRRCESSHVTSPLASNNRV